MRSLQGTFTRMKSRLTSIKTNTKLMLSLIICSTNFVLKVFGWIKLQQLLMLNMNSTLQYDCFMYKWLVYLLIFVIKHYNFIVTAALQISPPVLRMPHDIVRKYFLKELCCGLILLYKRVQSVLVVSLGTSCSTSSLRLLDDRIRILLSFPHGSRFLMVIDEAFDEIWTCRLIVTIFLNRSKLISDGKK